MLHFDTLHNYIQLFDIVYIKVFIQSITIALIVTIICILIAYPFVLAVSHKSKITQKVISQNKEYYYVYIGITKNIDIAEKIKKLYEDKGYKIKIKEMRLKNEEFSHNVSQFDILLKEAKTFDEVLTIEKIILSNYDDLINNPNILE